MARIFNVVYLAVMAGAAVYVNAVDYCKMPCNGETHTMCLYKSPDPAPACKEPHSLGLTDAEKNIVLKKHNELRKKVASGKEKRGQPGPQPAAVKMPDLTWDDELETIAQRLANQCVFAHDECRNVKRFPVGQNIHIASAVGQEPSGLEEMIQDWYDEVAWFDKKLVSSFKKTSRKTGHYTQLVWADTTKIGCGRIKYKNEKDWDTILLVCNYGPCGNRIGDKIYEIKK